MTQETADWVRAQNDLELVDFTRDNYKTIIVDGNVRKILELICKHGYRYAGKSGGGHGYIFNRQD